MRIFIAVELPESVKDSLERLKADFRQAKGLRFVSRQNIHITLKFLGEVPDDKAKEVQAALGRVRFSPFRLSLKHLGVFPDEKTIRVLWAGAEPQEPLVALKQEIDKALPGFKDDHPFKTHITLARAGYMSGEDRKRLLEQVTNKQIHGQEFLVKGFTLFRSTLTPEGPVYEALQYFP